MNPPVHSQRSILMNWDFGRATWKRFLQHQLPCKLSICRQRESFLDRVPSQEHLQKEDGDAQTLFFSLFLAHFAWCTVLRRHRWGQLWLCPRITELFGMEESLKVIQDTGRPLTSSGHNCRAQDGSKQTGDVLAPEVLVRTLISDPRLENEAAFKVFLAFKDLF